MINSRLRGSLLIGLAAVASLAFVVAACGGDDDDDEPTVAVNTPAEAGSATSAAAETPASEETAVETASGETPAAAGATIEVGAAGLVDNRGFSLYVFANDTAGSETSACTGGCASTWPPLAADGEPTAGEGVTGELGTITRDDGTTQVTYDGLPLYFFASDVAPGDANGASIPNWSLAQP